MKKINVKKAGREAVKLMRKINKNLCKLAKLELKTRKK